MRAFASLLAQQTIQIRLRFFYVMEVLEKAFRMQADANDVIRLQMGEQGFGTPDPITQAGIRALQEKHTHYVQALGLSELRQLIEITSIAV